MRQTATEAENLRARVESLEKDNKRHIEANRKLSARANGISMPSSKKKTNPGKAGRPKGQKATINKRPDKVDCTEIIDFDRCPGCGGENISENHTGEYDRIVKKLDLIVKTIKYVTVRRWCRDQETGLCQASRNRSRTRENGANVGAVLNLFEHVRAVSRKIRRIRRRRAWHARVLLVCIQEQDKQGPADGPGTTTP